MSRRLLAAAAAVILAVLGAVVLLTYAGNADARARAGEQQVPVLVVTTTVKAGTAAGAMAGDVATRQVPQRLAVAGTLSSLASVQGKVANADLLPGEQLLAGRFTDPSVYRPAGAVAVPPGMVEVSLTLDTQRAAGGVLKAGDEVGVAIIEQPNGAADVAPLKVYRELHQVLVTRVIAPANTADRADPAASYTVTVALAPQDTAPVILGGAATKAVWLSLEKPGVGTPSGSSGGTGTTTTTVTTSSTPGGTK